MRNYATITNSAFFTANVNDEEYVRLLEDVFPAVSRALCEALEVDLGTFRKMCSDASDNRESVDYAAPADYRVVRELWLMYSSVLREENSHVTCHPARCPTFVYHNLNTGRSVVWAHVVM